MVLVGPPQIPGWVQAFAGLVSAYDWIELSTLAVADAAPPRVSGVRADLRALIAFEQLALGDSSSLRPVPLQANAGQGSDVLSTQVEALRPDLIILLGPASWAGSLAALAPLGCWHLDASLLDRRYAGLSLMSPLLRGEMATQMALVLRDAEGRQSDLAASWGRTHSTSFLKQREEGFRKLPPLLLRGLRRLAAGYVPSTPHSVATLQLQSQPPVGLRAVPHSLLLMARASLRWLSGRKRKRRIGWTLVLRLDRTPLDPGAPAIGPHVLLRAAKGWWADPFIVATRGRRFLFVEEMAAPDLNNANIACVELTQGGAVRLGIALDEPGHLSFPQVFEWEGQWYMTVESSYDQRISLYRASDFPMRWERLTDLVTGRVCVDPTLHHHENHWYLFTNVSENGSSTSDELFLFVSEHLEGPFVPHPASPIVCDARRARMAGRLFHHHGRLIRPAQDCGPGYGNAVVFNEVLELGPTIYRERQLSRLAPRLKRQVAGCHTYNVYAGVEVLDVLGRQPGSAARLQVFEGGENVDSEQRGELPDRSRPMTSTGRVVPDARPR
ncbi:hypothetical protein GCM10027430_25910 [Lysobacter tyrosinilyticus]